MKDPKVLTSAEVSRLAPTAASKEMPSRFKLASGGQTQFSLPAGQTPQIETQMGETQGGRTLWRSNIGGNVTQGWPGQQIHTLEKPGTRPDAFIDGHHPAWMDVNYRPKLRPARTPKQTTSGRLVRPLDDFFLLEDFSYPWVCAGLISTSDNFSGTGSLVGSRLVLTASHVVPWNGISSGNGWSMTFTPNFRSVGLNHQPFGVSYVSDVLCYRRVGEPPQAHDSFAAGEDYALLRLYDPLGDQLGYFGAIDYRSDWDNYAFWSNVGYTSGDGPFAQTDQTIVDSGAPGVFGQGSGLNLETYAELFPGMSGGPFWAWFSLDGQTTPLITGVVSSIDSSSNEKLLASGSEMIDLVKQARSLWP